MGVNSMYEHLLLNVHAADDLCDQGENIKEQQETLKKTLSVQRNACDLMCTL